MAFVKTGISHSPPTIFKVGDERDGKIWNGKEWVEKEEWEKQQTATKPVNRL